MTQFAKLFGPTTDQILVVLTVDHQGQPVVNVSCMAPTLVGDDTPRLICNQLRYQSEESARAAFDEMDVHAAREHALYVRTKLAEQLAIEALELTTRRDLS